jgi:hypothetical protein
MRPGWPFSPSSPKRTAAEEAAETSSYPTSRLLQEMARKHPRRGMEGEPIGATPRRNPPGLKGGAEAPIPPSGQINTSARSGRHLTPKG